MEQKSAWLREFGARLRQARELARLSQAEVADSIGVHRQSVYRWEQGLQAPDAWHLHLLLDVIEVGPRWLLQ